VDDLAVLLVGAEESMAVGEQMVESQLSVLLANLAMHSYSALTPEASQSRVVYRAGLMITPDGEIPIPESLFDTGAANASYVSEDFVIKYLHMLSGYLSDASSTVRVGTKGTVVRLTKVLTVTVAFKDARGVEYRAQLPFGVITDLTKDIIIGLPAICVHFGVVMV
jgi:hypothetical protein